MRTTLKLAVVTLALSTTVGRTGLAQDHREPAAAGPVYGEDPEAVKRGTRDYTRYCVWCHGERGDGRGPSFRHLDPAPRDFTTAAIKCRTTPSGALPTDADLRYTLRNGFHGTAMPAWSTLSDNQVDDLLAALKHFSSRWTSEPAAAPLVVPPQPPALPASALRGKALYGKMQCAQCHGETGHGDGPAAATLKDDWGNSLRVADFTKKGGLKCGESNARIYTTFMTGMNGTPMPSFAGSLSSLEAWDLVAYVATLRGSGR